MQDSHALYAGVHMESEEESCVTLYLINGLEVLCCVLAPRRVALTLVAHTLHHIRNKFVMSKHT